MIRHRSGRTMLAVLAFLLVFAILILIVSEVYLLPALTAFNNATKNQRREMAAYARLLMSVLLVVLVIGLMLTFRMGRWFFPRASEPAAKTEYIDAWAEAGKRMREEESG